METEAQPRFILKLMFIIFTGGGGGLHPPLLAFTVKISLIVFNEGFNS